MMIEVIKIGFQVKVPMVKNTGLDTGWLSSKRMIVGHLKG
jgi:hypothetical protein